jgi:hypothetical protein
MNRSGSTWQPDGSGWRARIGVLTHDDSAISESELWTMAPNGVSLNTSRAFFGDLATFSRQPSDASGRGSPSEHRISGESGRDLRVGSVVLPRAAVRQSGSRPG